MKTQILVTFLALFSGVVYCQSGKVQGASPHLGLSGPSTGLVTPEQYRLQVITWLLTLPSPIKNGATQLHRLGDEASADLLQILASRPPLTDAEKQTSLDIIRISFEHPNSILKPANRQPNAALTMLQQLDAGTQDFSLKLRIAETKQSIFNSVSAAK